MLVISDEESNAVNGGKLRIGGMISSLVVGFIVGGPVGVGFAASGIIMAQGIDNLHDLYQGD